MRELYVDNPTPSGLVSRAVARKVLMFACMVCSTVVLVSCERTQPVRPAPPPAEVEVYTTENQSIPVVFNYVGQTEASQDAEVRARVTGVIWEQSFEEGKLVKAGQFLFRIDPRPFEADLQIADAQAFQAKVAVQSAQRDLDRTRKLQSSASVSQEELDNAVSAFETAVASQHLADARLLKSRLELSYTTVTAPISGLVGRALKKVGDLVDTTENSLLCAISAQDPIYANFSVSEKDLLEYRNDTATSRIIAPPDEAYQVELIMLDKTPYPIEGRINFSDVRIDPQTGTALIRATFPNPDGILQPGQFVKVHVKGAMRSETIVVPQRAVMQGMQGAYVYVVDDKNKVEVRPVTATDWEGKNWIIELGLKPGENVITMGTNKTAPGADVNVTTVTTTLELSTTSSTASL